MSYVPSRTFCCCLPVRIGVIIIAILGILIGGFLSIVGIVQVTKVKKSEDSSISKLAYSIQIVIYGIYGLMSILGLYGAFLKKRRLIRGFFVVLIFVVLFSIASGSFSLYRFFQDTPEHVDNCIGDADPDTMRKACEKGVSIIKGVLVGIFIFVWLMQIWGCIIVNDYSKQLEEEEYVKAKNDAFIQA